jgi:hypothetical protein
VIVAVPTAVVIKSALSVLRSPQGAAIVSPLAPTEPESIEERAVGPRNLPAAQGES